MRVEQVIDGETYQVALHAAHFTAWLPPDVAEKLAYDLTEAALEPERCGNGCGNYAAPGEEHCPQHLADADDTPDYADWRQA